MTTKTVNLLSLLNAATGDIVVPVQTSAVYDAASGPCLIKGKLINEGSIQITGGNRGKLVIVASEIRNTGTVQSDVRELELAAPLVVNAGKILGGDSIKIQSTTGKLVVQSTGGAFTASAEIVLDAKLGLTVADGTFSAPSIKFNAESGNVRVDAEALKGEVTTNAKSAKVGTKKGRLALASQALLVGNHVYYNGGGAVTVGSLSHGADNVAILATGNIDAGAITAGNLTIAAGVSFTINGSYPDPIADSDVDVGWAITSPEAYGNVTVTGAISASGNVLIKGYIVDLDALDVSGDLDIVTTYQYGTVTLPADVDVTGQTTILAYQVDHTGDNFTATAELEIGNTSKSSYINLAGVFHASKSVTLNGYRTVFDGSSFTMDGTNSADKLITESNLKIEATDVISIKGDVQTNRDVNLLFFCDGEVATGSITIDNEGSAGTAGQLCIKANRSGGTTSEFTIGGSSATNGVNGPIVTDTDSGGSTDPSSFSHGNVYINNGGDGGITLTNATDISVKGTASKSGGITLHANEGTITLPAGTLSADGTGDYAGSYIQLLGDTLETVDGTIISASDNGESHLQKLVQIAVNTINLAGSSGLSIKADGGGSADYKTTLQVLPKDSVTLADNGEPAYFYYYYILPNGEFSNSGELDFAGDGSAKLAISCNGSHSRIAMSGYPISFDTGDTSIKCKGAEDHQIQIVKYTSSGDDGLQFKGGDVTIDASGPDSEDGDGGVITINIDHVLRTSTGKTTIKADAHGTGNGGQIDFYPGSVEDPLLLGLDDQQFSFSAKGGATNGNGGTINLYGWATSFDVHGAGELSTPLSVSAPGADGDGGTINIVAYGAEGLKFSGTSSYLKADSGSSSGSGGIISILSAGTPIDISTGTEGVVDISAKSNGDGDGGMIQITCWNGLSVESAHIAATAEGHGRGGTLILSAGYSTFALTGNLDASGGDEDGDGGVIDLEGGEIALGTIAVAAAAAVLTLDDPAATVLTANGKGAGNGGEVTLRTHWGNLNIGTGSDDIMVVADSTGTGDGGALYSYAGANIVVDGAAESAKAGPDGNGKGGTIWKESPAGYGMTLVGAFKVDGAGSGHGGTILLQAHGSMDITAAPTFSANGGADGGKGGVITLLPENGINLNGVTSERFTAKGKGSGGGGYVFLNNTNTTGLNAFDILKVVNVDAGPSAAWNLSEASDDHPGLGSIRVNGITCRQWRLDGTSRSWPKRIWLAKGNTPADTFDQVVWDLAVDTKFDGMRSQFANQKVELFVFASSTDFGGFCNQVLDNSSTGGLTWKITSTGQYVYCCPWKSGSIGNSESVVTYTENQLKEVTAHEFGHVYSVTRAGGLVTSGGSWTTAYAADKTSLNGATPCDAITGRFRSVFDLRRNHDVCNGTSLHADYSGLASNLEIAAAVDPLFNEAVQEELHAQLFARKAVDDKGARPMFHQIIANSCFTNVKAIADGEV